MPATRDLWGSGWLWLLYGALAALCVSAMHWAAWRTLPQPDTAAHEATIDLRRIAGELELHYTVHRIYPPAHAFAGPVSKGFSALIAGATQPVATVDRCVQRWYEEIVPDLAVTLIVVAGLLAWWFFIWRRLLHRPQTPSAREYVVISSLALLLAALPLPIGLSFGLLLSAVSAGSTLVLFLRPRRALAHTRQLVSTLSAVVLLVTAVMLCIRGTRPTLVNWALHRVGSRAEYRYATDGLSFWVLQSKGPDRDTDCDLGRVVIDRLPQVPDDAVLNPLRYDPSNGLSSSGDILVLGRAP